MKAIFAVPSPHEQSLPPMAQLHYTEGGEIRGGWSCVSEAPLESTVLVMVDTSEAMIEQMAANPDYLYIGDVPDEQP